jgi:hypothetical protein
VCPECGCRCTVKKGKRRNRLQTHQVFKCTECLHRFTGAPAKHKTYPLRLILETVSTFNLGYSLTETQRRLHTRFHRNIPERTISSWLTEHRPLATYSRLRTYGKKLFAPDTIIRRSSPQHYPQSMAFVHGWKTFGFTIPVTSRALRNPRVPKFPSPSRTVGQRVAPRSRLSGARSYRNHQKAALCAAFPILRHAKSETHTSREIPDLDHAKSVTRNPHNQLSPGPPMSGPFL